MTTQESGSNSQPFAAVIGKRPNGQKSLVMTSPDWYQNQLNAMRVGERVTLVITNQVPKRTDQQNKYYFGAFLPLISKETGQDIDSLHSLFRSKFLSRLEDVTVNGTTYSVRVGGSTAKLSKSAFSEYITHIEELTGISAPPTDGYMDEKDAADVVLKAVAKETNSKA
jgi:hypothetical protein